jgi:hypothetical protein
MLDRIDIPISDKQINGSLTNSKHWIWRADPSPEVDAAWDRISNVFTTFISSDEVRKLGKDPLRTAMYPPDFGLGPDAHVAELDVFHQIHCLNALRKESWFSYYYHDHFPNGIPSARHRAYTAHCIHLLLQNLMCSASTDIITHYWMDVQKYPIPDFDINNKCRDFDAILEWQEAHMVDYAKYEKLRRPLDVVPWPAEEEFIELFNQQHYKFNDVDHS